VIDFVWVLYDRAVVASWAMCWTSRWVMGVSVAVTIGVACLCARRARPDAVIKNQEMEMERNSERFQFLKWGATAFENLLIVPPGSGIVHQVCSLAYSWHAFSPHTYITAAAAAATTTTTKTTTTTHTLTHTHTHTHTHTIQIRTKALIAAQLCEGLRVACCAHR
jgi:hypothetical protein